jgi:hypothetical protein
MLKRKGIALISVVLISALVFVSIIGIVLKIVPEKNISVARVSSERALSAAEGGISNIYFALLNSDIKDENVSNVEEALNLDPSEISTFKNNLINVIVTLANFSPNSTAVSVGEFKFDTNPYTTFYIKMKRLPKGDCAECVDDSETWDSQEANQSSDGSKTIRIAIYSLGTIYKGSSKNSEVAARKAVESEMNITYNKETIYKPGSDPVDVPPKPEGNSGVFNYALTSGEDINFGGNSQVIKGDIRANGDVNLGTQQNKVRVKDGIIYTSGVVKGDGKIIGGKEEGYAKIDWPELSLDYYQSLYNNFLTGKFPYDGSPVVNSKGEQIIDNEVPLYYPDTRDGTIQNIINTYLNDENLEPLDRIEKFYSDLQNKDGLFAPLVGPYILAWEQLKDRAKFIVYYIDGDVHVNSNKTLSGTFVINGDLRINGNYTINSDGSLAFLVSGDIIKANGNAEVNGFLYADGDLSLGTGNFTVNGGIVTKGTINVSGSIDVTYVPMYDDMLTSISGEPGYTIPGSEETNFLNKSVIEKVEQSQTPSWKEISYDKFLNPQ